MRRSLFTGERGRVTLPDSQDNARDAEERNLGDILDRLEKLGTDDTVSVNNVLAEFEDRSAGVLITVLGLIAVLPVIGAIPGVSMATGFLLLVVIAQSAAGGGKIVLPGRLGRARISKTAFNAGLSKGRKLTDAVDRTLRPRLQVLTSNWMARAVIKIAVAVLSLTMFPLAFVPWGVTVPAFAIVAFGLALIARDGVFALVGYVLLVTTAFLLAALT